jgi:TPR repeat protein
MLGVGTAVAEAKKPSFDAESARRATAAMDKDEALQASARVCPADVFSNKAALGRLLRQDDEATLDRCTAHPEKCYKACVGKRSGEHCFRLALTFQEHEDVVAPRYAQLMFSMACALGKAAGCTNRAAHMRNAVDEGDPFEPLSATAKDRCQFRSFRVACEKNDNWGCAMLGQAYLNGEGAKKSVGLARRSYKKSCRLNPEFDACAFSRSALKSM